MRETNIDLLERAVNTIAFGDIEAEDTCNFSERNFLKLFRLSQLMVRTISAQEASSCVARVFRVSFSDCANCALVE
eukprot:6284608-Pyramimonas_sp.AAC.1